MASLHLNLPTVTWPRRRTVSRSILRPVQCAVERQELFNRIAPVYDNLNDLLSLGLHRVWKRMAVSWSGREIWKELKIYALVLSNRAKEGDTVLDVCCGSGDLAFLLSEKVGVKGKVIAIDFSREQLQVAKSRQQERLKVCYKNIEWIEGNAADLPFSESTFDAATIGYGLRNIIDRRKGLMEMSRVLKPSSKVSVLDFNKNTHPITTSIQEWLLDNVVVPVASGYDLASEYQYLKNSIREYLTGDELEKLALESGFSAAKHFEMNFGLMGNLVAKR